MDSLLEKYQSKWLKNISNGEIQVRDYLYTLKVTDNKRKLVYDLNDQLISTDPYTINENKEVEPF
jgi:hypothetical protein